MTASSLHVAGGIFVAMRDAAWLGSSFARVMRTAERRASRSFSGSEIFGPEEGGVEIAGGPAFGDVLRDAVAEVIARGHVDGPERGGVGGGEADGRKRGLTLGGEGSAAAHASARSGAAAAHCTATSRRAVSRSAPGSMAAAAVAFAAKSAEVFSSTAAGWKGSVVFV